MQDWFVRWQLQAVEGVSRGRLDRRARREYQIDVDPDRMRAHRVTLPEVFEAVRRSNIDVGRQGRREATASSSSSAAWAS